MNWDVMVRIGENDAHRLDLAPDAARISVALYRQGDPWSVGNNLQMFRTERLHLPAVAEDLLHLCVAVYAADLVIPRRLSEDQWRRDVRMHFPVVDLALWREAIPQATEAIEFLTGDAWSFELRERDCCKPTGVRTTKYDAIQAVNLFSGGLDSLVGAIDLMTDGAKVGLVGHHGSGVTMAVQEDVLSVLREHFPDRFSAFQFYVQPPKPVLGFREINGKQRRVTDGESTMRSRSLLFLALGTAVAAAIRGRPPVVVAENGFISLNVPLTATRLGSASTRTTHPFFLDRFVRFIQKLGLDVRLQVPYRFQTKGEMLKHAKNQAALQGACPRSMSCSHPEQARYERGNIRDHCGYCVPCLIRRAATTFAGLPDTAYHFDVCDPAKRPAPDSDRGGDIRAFEMAYLRSCSRPGAALLDVLRAGPLPIPEEANSYADVYARGLLEVGRFLGLERER